MKLKFKNLNTLPVITWRWLKVNDISLDTYSLPTVGEYNKASIISPKAISIDTTPNAKELLDDFGFEAIHYGVSKEVKDYALNNYNSSMVIKANGEEKEPIRIEHIINKDNLIDNNLIIAEENSKVTIIIQYKSNEAVFHNGVTRVLAKKGSEVNLIKIQTLNDNSHNFDSNVAICEYGAKVNFIEINLGSKFSVTNFISELKGTSGETNVNSIYLGDGNRVIDLSYEILHKAMRTNSNIICKGVLMDNSKKIFRGTLNFKKGSSRSKGSEEEYVTLLDSTVKSDAIPLLLCDEDDVEGMHAASAGKIDENKLYYLMSRGFSEKEAKKLIIEANFRPIIDLIPVEEIKEEIDTEIQRRLING
jgi:FeS assembly protein SufD